MDDLLHLLHSEQADSLHLRVGQPPAITFEGEQHVVEGPAISAEEAEQLLQSVADTRQRRTLRERGELSFVHRFRNRVDFVIRAKLEDGLVAMDIH